MSFNNNNNIDSKNAFASTIHKTNDYQKHEGTNMVITNILIKFCI